MNETERRARRRLPVRWCISGRLTSTERNETFWGSTKDISVSEVRFITFCGSFRPGMIVTAELFVPPRTGVLNFGGWITALLEIQRIEHAPNSDGWDGDGATAWYEVAAQFRQRPTYLLSNGFLPLCSSSFIPPISAGIHNSALME